MKNQHGMSVRAVIVWFIGALGLANLAVQPAVAKATASAARTVISGTPLSFERNVGQATADALYVAHGPGYAMALTERGATLVGDSSALRLRTVGSREGVTPSAEQPLPGVVNYFIGNDPRQWRAGIKTFGRVRYSAVYPGVDLVYYGTQGRLEYDFAVAAGASAKPIRLAFEGAEHLSVDARGNLNIKTDDREIAFQRPVAYQLGDNGKRTPVAARYRLAGNTVRFEVGAYDHAKRLIIDPVLSYFSYLGGSGYDIVGALTPTAGPPTNSTGSQAAAVDSAGDLYVAGYTTSTNFPTQAAAFGTPPVKVQASATWAFVTKIAPDAKSLIFSTYLGGTLGYDYGYGIAVDATGNAFVVGQTQSSDFPITSGAYAAICSANYNNNAHIAQSDCSGTNQQSNAFVSKLSPSGVLLNSTFLGGSGTLNAAYGVAVDTAGRPYVGGWSYPGTNTPAGIGGTNQTVGFPTTTGAVVSAYNYCAGCNVNGALQLDAFVTIFDPTLSTLVYSTLFGDDQAYAAGNQVGNTVGTAVTVDSAGNFYLAGYTSDGHLPVTAGALQTTVASCGVLNVGLSSLNGNCGFVAKFSPVGGANPPTEIYGTYLGHMPACCASDYVAGIAADAAGDAYVAGYANTGGFPTTTGSYQPTCAMNNGAQNCGNVEFIAKLNPTGTSLLASTYFGGLNAGANNISDSVYAVGPIVLDAAGNAYIEGIAADGLPQVNPLGTNNGAGGIQSPFVAELDSTLSTLKFSTLISTGGQSQLGVNGLALDSTGNIYLAGNVNSPPSSAATPGAFQSAYGGSSSDGFVAKIIVHTPTTTTLSAAPSSATSGTAINLTATVAEVGGSSVPTGSVTFKDGATSLGALTLNGTGVAVYTTSTLAVGVHSITALYAGDGANAASTSSAASVTVTAPPVPTATIAVAPTSITLGQSATLTWSSTNATACTASNAWSGSQAVSGTKTVTPSAAGSTSYVLTCTGAGGSANATAMLTTAAPLPTVTIAVAPTSITVGQSATLTWSSTNATACTASNAWTGTEAVSGTQSVTPTAAGSLSYVLTCTGAGGSANATAALTVAAAAPTVTIAVAPTSITVGQSATLTWSSSNATSCTASGSWSGTQATSGTMSVSPATAGAVSYALACTGAGGTANGTAALSVNAVPGKKGGGSIGAWDLLGLALLGLAAYRRRIMVL